MTEINLSLLSRLTKLDPGIAGMHLDHRHLASRITKSVQLANDLGLRADQGAESIQTLKALMLEVFEVSRS